MKKLLLSTAASVLFLSPALADTAATITAPATVVTRHTTGQPMHTAATTTVTTKEVIRDVAHYVTPDQTDFVASSIINANVKNNSDETIGEIKDLVIRKNHVEGIVIAVGGFLGVGERYVVVDPSTVHMSLNNGTWRVSTNASKDSLKAAPEFKYEGRWAR
ncbi:PRC-barrel domain-containing protein [Bartonella sp. TP]|uniref:PRC-barrel domain-containing protein n=1 Tax=Bartonella sp. TP TaxID=3057550 RepID=UPI0025AF620F|nr:PRC-barrel domain-containing protein [Bartonella sp. TP]WJW79697.1 PRC-barrel domain-containing protein [Bartonella sp. TP]